MPSGVYDRSKITCGKCGKQGHVTCKAGAAVSKLAEGACSYCKRTDGTHTRNCKRVPAGAAAIAPRKTGPKPGRAPKARPATPAPPPSNGQPATVPVATVALLRAKVAELRANADALELAIRLLGGAA